MGWNAGGEAIKGAGRAVGQETNLFESESAATCTFPAKRNIFPEQSESLDVWSIPPFRPKALFSAFSAISVLITFWLFLAYSCPFVFLRD